MCKRKRPRGRAHKRPPTREAFVHSIHHHSGVVTHIARAHKVSPVQVYRWLDYFNARDELARARDFIFILGHATLRDLLRSDDMEIRLKAAMFVLDLSDRRGAVR